MYIIIPSAKIVSKELQNLGKLPPVIYPVNQRLVFDYLYEQYNSDNVNFRVMAYENADDIHRRLKNYANTTIIDLSTLTDLAGTLLLGIKHLQGAAIVNFADTIAMDSIDSSIKDAYLYAEDTVSDTWTFFDEENGVIKNIIDKENIKMDLESKLFVGVFKFSHIEYFSECLEKAIRENNSNISNYYYALQRYSEKYPMTPLKASHWFDIGHADNYYNSQLEVKAREFNHISIDKDRGILTKYSDDVDKFIGEIKWYLKLPADVEYVRPRIFNYSTSYDKPFVSMEYYAYHTVHELFLYGDLEKNQWIDIFKRILFVCNDFKRYSVKDGNIKDALEDMYLIKTLKRFDRLRKNSEFEPFFIHDIKVNGKTYMSLEEISEVLKSIIPQMLFDVDTFNIIHGDLCFANIMIDNNLSFIKVIDPRGNFGKYDIYGDSRYELAKLFHSVDGKYDFIIKDLFTINYDLRNAVINFEINDSKRDFDLFELFVTVFKDQINGTQKEIELIESLLFLSMIPLHGESLQHQLVMLGTGLEILNRVVDITK